MVVDVNSKLPLTSLSQESRILLSSLLNNKKILLHDEGPIKLPRDWRGLAYLVGVTSEEAASLRDNEFNRILDIWLRKDSSATVGELLDHLQTIDRFDVFNDLQDLAVKDKLVGRVENQVATVTAVPSFDENEHLLTYDDQKYGTPQTYHAYVLYAMEDKDFVDELLSRMRAQDFRVCTVDDLLPGHSTEYAPVSRLIQQRCRRIILIYSPEFLRSSANTFYMNFAQAVGIESKQLKIIPIMYRQCQLPNHLTFYHQLRYTPPGQRAAYNFWERLSKSLDFADLPRINSTAHSPMNITEVSQYSTPNVYDTNSTGKDFLTLPSLPSVPSKSISMGELNNYLPIKNVDSTSLSNVSQMSENKRKKKNALKRFFLSPFKGKKKAMMVEN